LRALYWGRDLAMLLQCTNIFSYGVRDIRIVGG